MKLLIHGRNLDVTSALRDYTETKLSRAVNHFNGMVQEADVHLSVARNPRVPHCTIWRVWEAHRHCVAVLGESSWALGRTSSCSTVLHRC